MIKWGRTLREEAGICPTNTFVPTIFRHTLIFAASRKLAAMLLRQCSSGKAKYIEKSLHSLSFVGHIPASSLGWVLDVFTAQISPGTFGVSLPIIIKKPDTLRIILNIWLLFLFLL